MSPEAQRIAIDEACGYFHAKRGVDVWYEPEGGHVVFGDLPDYLNDLNAMHEAEKMLTPQQWCGYLGHLATLGGFDRDIQTYDKDGGFTADFVMLFRTMAHATAAQRAEAFIRTLNLWNDSK